MHKLLITLCFLFICSTSFGAELLVQAKDHYMDAYVKKQVDALDESSLVSYKARGQKGDVIAVRPDGWEWGKEERLPNYVIVRVPDMSIEEAKKYEEQLYDRTDPEKPIMLRKRKHSFSRAEVETAKVGKLDAIQLNKTATLNYISTKTGDSKEVAQPKKDLLSYLKYKAEPFTRNIGKAYAATQLKKTVKPSGGDYTALETCMNANEQNLVTADQYFDVEIDGTWSSADTTTVTIHNYTTDSTRYINIYTTATARHDGKWDTGAYRLEVNADTSHALAISANYITITGLQVKNTGTTVSQYTRGIYCGANYIVVDKCISLTANGRAVQVDFLDPSGVIDQFRNSVFISNSSEPTVHFGGAYGDADSHAAYNCVVANLGSGNAMARGGFQATATNVYAYSGSGTAWGSGFTLTTSASDDGSQSTTTVAYSTSSGAYFTNVTAGSEDFHITNTTSDLFEAGTDLSATFTDDIDGDTRGATWDIGVDYIEAAAAGRTRRLIF